MNDTQIIEKTIDFVKKELKLAEGGHDWFHIQRVFRNTLLISRGEEVNILVVSLSALLHDIADAKFHGGDEEIGPQKADNFLRSLGIPHPTRKHVVNIVRNISFKNTLGTENRNFDSAEFRVVQDADRLDAIGAIGIARAFSFGGHAGRKLYDPETPPRPKMSKEEYKTSKGPSINHFYEKLLMLKDRMHTATGKKLAEHRHQFMLQFLEEFYSEWNGVN